MRMGIAVGLVVSALATRASAQPAPQQPPPPQLGPEEPPKPQPPPPPPPPMTAIPVAPLPPPEPPIAKKPWLLSGGAGLGGLTMNHENGMCPDCEHSPFLIGGHISGGVAFADRRVGIVVDVQFALGFVDGLPGRRDKVQQFGLFAGGKLSVTPDIIVSASIGYARAEYKWEEDNVLGFDVTHHIEIGEGPALLGVARLRLGKLRALDYGIEARLMGAKLGDAGPFSTFVVQGVLGWF